MSVTESVERWVPGIRVVRTYRREWLPADLVAGLVLAAILVPQGMAYAELAGLPPVTGLYTTIACLVGYAVFGPSRVLVLGPDSSVSPLIFAAIVPLLVDGRPGDARSRSPGCSRCSSGSIEIGLGLGKLGFVADLLSSEVQVGYMNGLAHHDHRRPAPEALRLLDRRRRLRRRDPSSSSGTSTRPHGDHARRRRRRCSSCCSCCHACRPRIPAVLVAVVGATIVSAVLDLADRRGRDGRARSPAASRRPSLPWTSVDDVGPLLDRRRRHHARLAHRHHRHRDELRRPTRRRGRPEPGDDRHRAPRTSPPGFFQGFAVSTSGSRTAVAEQSGREEPAHRRRRRRRWSSSCCCSSTRCSPTCPQTALAAVVITAALSLMDLGVLRRYCAGAASRRSCCRSSPPPASSFFGVLEGIVVAIVLSILMFFRRSWWPHGAVLGRGRRRRRLAQHRATIPSARQLPGRRRVPVGGAALLRQRRRVPARRSAGSPANADPRGSCCSARRSPTSTSPPPRCSKQLDDELNAAGVHLAFAEMRSRLQDLVLRYGLFETLDRDHFYPSIETALRSIDEPEPDSGSGRPPGQLFGCAALMSANAEPGSSSSARSPSETTPTARFPSTTAIRRIAASRITVTASSTSASGESVYKPRLQTSPRLRFPSARPRTTRSRSVTIPHNVRRRR